MAARPLQPSEFEIQREVEALRDLRRRSTTPGALTIDPDLPNQLQSSSPTTQRLSKSPTLPFPTTDISSIGGPGEATSSFDRGHSSGSSRTADGPNNPSDDPLHLFWVPASLHPEIAPAEFRAFLKEHARSPLSDGSEPSAGSPVRSLSSSSRLSRQSSMLSRQYRPKENDGVEDENVVPLKRNRSLLYPVNPGPQLTISDLQKLDELAEEASESDDPTKLRNVLRRSISLNLAPSALGLMDEMPEMGDEADAPIIIPPPNQILRRAARTKIRKPGLPGDGGGHRFGASRRGAGAKSPSTPPVEPRTSSDISSSDHGEADTFTPSLQRPAFSDEGAQNVPRPNSYSEETSIYDAYARDDDEDTSYPSVVVLPSQEPRSFPKSDEQPQIPIEPASMPEVPIHVLPQPTLVLHQPQPQHLKVPISAKDQAQPARTPSPREPVVEHPVYTTPPLPSTTPSPPVHSRKEKDKKGLFGKWGGEKGGKKGGKDKERENRERAEKEKDGFFGSLFAKKKPESEYQSSITGGTSGREAAQALLGASKSSKSYVPPTSPGLAPGIGGNPYARYPIHVERAIYRLSHIKLANPRRPLYEQVLISNLMFWYLGVINKTQNPSTSPTPTATNGTGGTIGESQNDDEQEEQEKEQREKEEKEQREKLERERLEKEQREREREMELKKKESGRRGSLTKTPVGGPPGGRRAEMPIKGPQYEMQHRVMEQEYGGYNGQPPRNPTSPPANGAPGQLYPRAPPPGPYTNTPPKFVPPQQRLPAEQYYYQPQSENPHHQPGLPPGAMAPASVDHSVWNNQPSSPPPMQQRLNPGPHRRSRSPPSQQYIHPQKQPMQLHKFNSSENLAERGGNRGPNRSMSATAYTSSSLPPPNGALRKGNSAQVAAPYEKRPHTSEGRLGGNGEEEDVPLAVWQQLRRI